MKYEVKLIDPRTDSRSTIYVSADQSAAEASGCVQSYVQQIAKPQMPRGMMVLGTITPVKTQ